MKTIVVGPRASGKTTTARRHAADELRLDRPADAATARFGPLVGVDTAGVDAASVLRDPDLLGRHARRLIWLRERPGDRVLGALVLHAGPHLYPLEDEVYAVPICSLWAP